MEILFVKQSGTKRLGTEGGISFPNKTKLDIRESQIAAKITLQLPRQKFSEFSPPLQRRGIKTTLHPQNWAK